MGIYIESDCATFTQAHSELPCSHWDATTEGWQPALHPPIPAPGTDKIPFPLIERTEKGYVIHYDILGMIYWMLSRQEEVNRSDLDSHQRFPATASHAYKHGYLERPVVDEWFVILAQVVHRLWPRLELIEHTFSMIPSHDVDTPARYGFTSFGRLLFTMAGDVVRRHKPIEALQAPRIWAGSKEMLHSADPFNTFNWIMDVSEQNGITSAFYFICGRTLRSRDANYDVRHPAIRDLMRRIHARGHEIGLHPSYNTYQKPDSIVTEAQELLSICTEEGIVQREWGGRMHYLRWQTPITLYGWEQAGMAYDTTLSYADRPGFRCGTCHEYPAFDPVADKALQLRIRPLIAMECTVMAPRYMNLGSDEAALKKFVELKETCRSVRGNFALLWHNTMLERKQDRILYKNVLEA
ncbi:polysaccharide deacetylase family protein [Candidimonas sp. SYP-B2681]|uniref:polysaccharide deacetylase family protein n=1 Tax=Candidimonas sp. SYP-B2681 TaxID=2497686 RepID=UPI0018F55CB4|nr:polysaccharide deacetylase family protein [Candidimonas sp. SYP-B2681]